MPRTRLGLFLAGAVLAACTVMPPQTTPPPTATPSPAPPATVPSGGASNSPGCYYQWATQELPVLSQAFQRSLQSIADGASGSAYAFGEDCVAADGSTTFLAMETDFRARLPVDNLSNAERMGDLISATMSTVERIPQDQIAGPRPGRVEFEFYTAKGDSLRLTAQIDKFRSEGQNLSGARLFRLFYVAP